ncbi:hypothetical protein DOY81_013348 [Sarcophaga bullata]|nr:hypothetical protein DOY81_013348 [Sarcophaga bullata]
MPLPTDTKDDAEVEHLNKELEISRKIFKESQKDLSQRDISLSCMSPDQLKFTQDLSSSSEAHLKLKGNKTQRNEDVEDIETDKSKVSLGNLETLKNIQAWNLPLTVTKEYERKGVKKMFDWQVLFEHCNLVYSAPTSAGKTLVSEILLLKTVLEREKKVLLILPFISVVREKMFYLQDLLTAAGYRVEGFFGGYTPPGGFDSINVAICTIEKANSIVNKLLEQGKLDEIGTVIVDEWLYQEMDKK